MPNSPPLLELETGSNSRITTGYGLKYLNTPEHLIKSLSNLNLDINIKYSVSYLETQHRKMGCRHTFPLRMTKFCNSLVWGDQETSRNHSIGNVKYFKRLRTRVHSDLLIFLAVMLNTSKWLPGHMNCRMLLDTEATWAKASFMPFSNFRTFWNSACFSHVTWNLWVMPVHCKNVIIDSKCLCTRCIVICSVVSVKDGTKKTELI